MASSSRLKLRSDRRYPLAVVITIGFLLIAAVAGQAVALVEETSVVTATLALICLAAVLWRVEAGIASLGFLSMMVNPAIFDVQGREILPLHLLSFGIIAVWLLKKGLVEQDLRVPKTGLNAPLMAVLVTWVVTWLAGYISWDGRVPTTHRQPLFFAAEFGQLLLFAGVFWATADLVRTERWAKGICAAMILGKALTPFVQGHLLFISYPVTMALALSWLILGKAKGPVKGLLLLFLAISVWDLLQINRIPIYLACAAVVMVILFLKSRPLFALALAAFVPWGLSFIRPLLEAEASIGSRLQLAGLALSVFRSRPFLGIGPTHYRSYAILYHRGVSYGWDTVESGLLLPHNRWLYFLANVGIVGFLAVLWLVGAMLSESFTAFQRSGSAFSKVLGASALACVVGVVVQSVGGHAAFLPNYDTLSVYMAPFWILMGLMVARSEA